MVRQIWRLGRLQLCNLFGFNELCHGKDTGKKLRYLGMAALWLAVILGLLWLLCRFCSLLGRAGLAELLPGYLYAAVSLMMLFFTFLKAGEVIFQIRTYELLISLPLSRIAIVASRFLVMYVTDFLMGALVMLPGTALCGYYLRPGLSFYLCSAAGIFLLPLLPIALASVLGGLLKAVSARMRHKSMAEAGLMIVTVLLVMGGGRFFSGREEEISMEMLVNATSFLTEKIGSCYPPALWYDRAVKGQAGFLALLALVSLSVFLLFAAALGSCFWRVCQALQTSSARNNYKMKTLRQNTVWKALWKREMRRYFASGIYICNTVIGYILMTILAAASWIMGIGRLEILLGFSGLIGRIFPLALSLMAAMMSTTACSVSMEGDNWWLMQSLPVKNSQIYGSKILVNLSIAAPFYVLSVLFSWLALKPGLAEGFWLAALPAVYILFMAAAGLFINLHFPVLEWESEVRVVKQSASVMLTMLTGMVSVLLPAGGILLQRKLPEEILLGSTAAVLLLLTAFLYNKCRKTDPKRING